MGAYGNISCACTTDIETFILIFYVLPASKKGWKQIVKFGGMKNITQLHSDQGFYCK